MNDDTLLPAGNDEYRARQARYWLGEAAFWASQGGMDDMAADCAERAARWELEPAWTAAEGVAA